MKSMIITDTTVVTGRYYISGVGYSKWTIEAGEPGEWILTTNDPMTDCCCYGDYDDCYIGGSIEECMAHLEQQVKQREEVRYA